VTAQEQARYIGKNAVVLTGLGSIIIPVTITDVRVLFGRVDLLIEPQDGEGHAWVERDRLTIVGGMLP
jgi:hypothetical protein